MQKLWVNFRGHYRELIMGPLFKLFEAILELLVPMVMAGIIDVGIATGDTRYVFTRGLMLLGLGLLGFGAAMVCQYYAAIVGGAFGRSLRNQTYRHVMRLSGRDIAPYGAGGLITRLTNDINQVQNGVNMTIRLASRVPFLAIGSIVMAMRINPRIGSIFLLSTPLIILVMVLIMRASLPSYARVQAMQDALSRQAGESLAGVRIIRAFSRQAGEARDFDDTSDALTRVVVRVGRLSAALNPLTNVIANAAIIAIVWLGAGAVFGGGMLTGEIIALVNYMTQTLLALVVAANLVVLFTRAIASGRRVNAVLEITPSVAREDATAVPPVHADGALLAFESVRFAYHAGADSVLEDISFQIRPGEVTGLIGGTGSGKSTIVSLIMRYFDVDEGAVGLEGQNIRALEPGDLRRRIGLAPQTATLFAGTVRHNLRMSAPEADEAAMWHALEVAQCADVVRAMPGGLDAAVQEGGKNLSGGQRQRLTIARALVRRPHLLILDDALSALDYATDAALRHALDRERNARPDMAVLLISQRAASLMQADQILVLDDGRLAGQGTHARLIRENQVYREICRSQDIPLEEVDAQ